MTALTQVSSQQDNPAATVNEVFEAVAAAAAFGVDHDATVGLVFGYYGTILFVNGLQTVIADGTVAVTASTTNYIERTAAGVVSANVNGFSADQIPLYTAATSPTGISTLVDYRALERRSWGRLVIAIGGSPTGYVLNHYQAMADILEFTGTVTETETVTVPTVVRQWIIYNNTSGGSPTRSITVKTAAGAGASVPEGSRYLVYCDGTDVVRVT